MKKILYITIITTIVLSCQNKELKHNQLKKEAETRAQVKIDAIQKKEYTDSSSGRKLLNEILNDTLATKYHQQAVDAFDSMKTIWDKEWIEHNAKIDSILKAKQKRIQVLLKNTNKSTDDVDNVVFYTHKYSNKSVNSNSFYVYIGKSENSIWLRLKISYAASDWLFVRSFTLKAGDLTRTIHPEYGEVKTDNGYSGIWEWYDCSCEGELLNFIRLMSLEKVSYVRYIGDKYHHDKKLTEKEKTALTEMLELYDGLNSPSGILL